MKPRQHVSLFESTAVSTFAKLTKVDPCHEYMSVIAVVLRDVAKADHVELLLASSARRVDGKQDRECDATANEADGGSHLEISEKEVAIQRVVVEDIAVRYLEEGSKPVEHSIGQVRRAFPVIETHQQLQNHEHRRDVKRTVLAALPDSYVAHRCGVDFGAG